MALPPYHRTVASVEITEFRDPVTGESKTELRLVSRSYHWSLTEGWQGTFISQGYPMELAEVLKGIEQKAQERLSLIRDHHT